MRDDPSLHAGLSPPWDVPESRQIAPEVRDAGLDQQCGRFRRLILVRTRQRGASRAVTPMKHDAGDHQRPGNEAGSSVFRGTRVPVQTSSII